MLVSEADFTERKMSGGVCVRMCWMCPLKANHLDWFLDHFLPRHSRNDWSDRCPHHSECTQSITAGAASFSSAPCRVQLHFKQEWSKYESGISFKRATLIKVFESYYSLCQASTLLSTQSFSTWHVFRTEDTEIITSSPQGHHNPIL